uniref:alcohol dehydrogenase (NADP(+)) n=1 Tax=Phallusia mammillata TaxID=59560 RepID=A0A6F9D6X3_9ASCI|nr:1,5-anhydro-D-fructose reductase-like [Phallusia mammillata]
MKIEIPSVEIQPGVEMSMLGLGTSKAKSNELYEAVRSAIDLGYRHIDCAFVYGNEAEIGDAIKSKIDDETMTRSELFVTSKLWRTFNRPEHMQECFDESLRRLKLDYFDLYLFHWPEASAYCGLEVHKHFLDPKLDETADYVVTWQAMQKFLRSGRTRALGISNFNDFQVKRLLRESSEIPSVIQIESHPYFNQCELVNLCQSKGIVVTGYCPLGSADRPGVKNGGPLLLTDPLLVKLAAKYGKSPAQVALRFNIQREIAVTPKSVRPSRIAENMDVFNFTLSDAEMGEIFKLERGQRLCESMMDIKHKFHPFRENYSE